MGKCGELVCWVYDRGKCGELISDSCGSYTIPYQTRTADIITMKCLNLVTL